MIKKSNFFNSDKVRELKGNIKKSKFDLAFTNSASKI